MHWLGIGFHALERLHFKDLQYKMAVIYNVGSYFTYLFSSVASKPILQDITRHKATKYNYIAKLGYTTKIWTYNAQINVLA